VKPLSEVQVKRIQNNRYQLTEMIDIELAGLLDLLYSKYCITNLQRTAITSVGKLLDVMERKSVSDFNVFLDCLAENGQAHVVTLLTEDAGLYFVSFQVPRIIVSQTK
jgi:hypothetical protein